MIVRSDSICTLNQATTEAPDTVRFLLLKSILIGVSTPISTKLLAADYKHTHTQLRN